MNKSFIKNYFLKNINNNSNTRDELLKFALKQAKNPETIILYITNKDFQKLPTENIDRSLEQFTFMYFKTLDQIITKLIEFHSWVILPNLIILEFDNIFADNNHYIPIISNETKRKFCFLISCLIDYSYYLNKNNHCKTITYLEENDSTRNLINSLIELYFYKTTYTNLEDLMEEFEK